MEPNMTNVQIAVALLALTVFLLLKLRAIGSRGEEFPPGPKITPVLGNLLDFPTNFHHIE